MSAHKKHWGLQNPAPTEYQQIHRSPTLATLLYQRGLHEPIAVQHFFSDTYPSGTHDPFLLKGMSDATTRIAQAIANQELIVVYGDFDTDGVTSVTLLYEALTGMGGIVLPYLPHRDHEGYGLNVDAVEQLARKGSRLLITVDCGISNEKEVAHATSLGMDVIITDHHRPPETIPQALAVINPKQSDCPYPYKQLVGVGISFKLVQALARRGLQSGLRGREMLELVALGTIADIGPLTGENRVLVRAGLEAINVTKRPGLRALLDVSNTVPGQVDSMAVGFRLAPRINAAGRLDDARLAFDLLRADEVQAPLLAQQLDKANRQRQRLTEKLQRQSHRLAEETGKINHRIVVLNDEDYPAGIVGLVAGKLVEQWNRPVVLISRGEEESRGSARSISSFNITQALTECQDLLTQFGGHSAAAGFTLPTEHLDELELRLTALADQAITDEMVVPSLLIDTEVPLEEVTWELYHDIAALEPFGAANPQPVLMSRGVYVSQVRTIGDEGRHLRFIVSAGEGNKNGKNGGGAIEAIAFSLGHVADPLRKHPWIDIVYTLEVNEWNGQRSLQIVVKDFQQAGKKVAVRG